MLQAGNMSVRIAAPLPRVPKIPEITSAEELLPMARLIARRKSHPMLGGLEMRTGARVLIISDSTNDSLVQEAFRIVIREAGGILDTVCLYGYPEQREPEDLVDTLFSRNWWPAWAWQAARESDIVMQAAMLKTAHTPGLPVDTRKEKPLFVEMEWTADLLASSYETFPVEVRDAIDKSAWEILANARDIELIDSEGTELRWKPTQEEWKKASSKQEKRHGLPYQPGHLMVPLPSATLEGALATSSVTFGGPIPAMRCTMKSGQVTEIEGGGKFGERLASTLEKYRNINFPDYPGPGVSWLSTLGICTHPKARRSAYYDKLFGSARVHAWAFGHRRSGVIHTSIGEGLVSPDYKMIRHVDLYFSTLMADGKKVIDCGHLLALDDPAVQKVAEKYGDPAKLLTEEWIPAISGVNAA